jgi:hypothetical protein
VARAQFRQWLSELAPPAGTSVLIDISGPGTHPAGTAVSQLAADAGHAVLQVVPAEAPAPGEPDGHPRSPAPGRVQVVRGDAASLRFLADGCADGVIAEDRTLSVNLVAETLVGEIARILKPGGSVFACVDSLMLGMAAMAQQSAWPNLVDVPRADVVLVPWPDGTITRCYGAEQLRELFTSAGFGVSWIRPRTVFAQETVSYLLDRDPDSFSRLLSAELRARSDDSVGNELVVSATRK